MNIEGISTNVDESHGHHVHMYGEITSDCSKVGSHFVNYKDGVMVAADTSITYGSMLKVKDARRIEKLTDECIFAASGEMADF